MYSFLKAFFSVEKNNSVVLCLVNERIISENEFHNSYR